MPALEESSTDLAMHKGILALIYLLYAYFVSLHHLLVHRRENHHEYLL
jgi:hypothetical protein